MYKIKLSLSILIFTLFSYQIGFAQSSEPVKSFKLSNNQLTTPINRNNVKESLKIQFGIPNGYEFNIQKQATEDELGYTHERYSQFYNGIKIENSDIRVHYFGNTFVSANGEYIKVTNLNTSVSISPEVAIQYAKNYVNADVYMWEDTAENQWLQAATDGQQTSFYPVPELVICKNRFNTQDTTFHIAYKIDIYAKLPVSRAYIYVDAKNGTVLDENSIIKHVNGTAATRYSGTRIISTQSVFPLLKYRLRSYDNGGIETYNMQKGTSYSAAIDFTDMNNHWTAAEFHNANKDDAGLEAHWGGMMTYNYFKNVHNRNSYDDRGSVIKNYVHYSVNYVNAFWNGSVMTYGDGNGTTVDTYVCLDVVGHEIGHGVCSTSANLDYYGESGAINEAISDIWGACIENYVNVIYNLNKDVWLHREEVGTPNRSLRAPKDYGQPDTWGTPSYSPYSDVHTNSGIMNYWFYLLSVGKSGTNDLNNTYSVTGIGISKAEKIVYRAETEYMTRNTNFHNARICTIDAAIDLYGECSPEVKSVINAWYAVGVGDNKTCVDLLIRDDLNDNDGFEPNPNAIPWNSPDIKLLYTDNDNEIPFSQIENESACRIAVNVKNIGNQASAGTGKERLHLFWRKSALISKKFPMSIYFGGRITPNYGYPILALQPEEAKVVVQYTFPLPDDTQFRNVLETSFLIYARLKTNWGFSLMAIADEGNGGIPGLANITPSQDWGALAKQYNSVAVTNGNRLLFARDFSQVVALVPAMNVPFSVKVNQLLKNGEYKLNDFAELYVLLSNDLIANLNMQKSGVKQIDENTVYCPSANTELHFNPVSNEEGNYFVGTEVHFISDKYPELNEFEFDLSLLTEGKTDETMRITAIRNADVYFKALAEASKTKVVRAKEEVTLTSNQIFADAYYTWYNEAGEKIGTGYQITITPAFSQKYKIEILKKEDGFKSYDEVEVIVVDGMITSLSPNPAQSYVKVNYKLSDNATNAQIQVSDLQNLMSVSYPLSTNGTYQEISLSGFVSGTYLVKLIISGVVVDTQTLIIY